MNIKIMARGIGYLLIAGVFFGAGSALSNRPYPTAETPRTEPSPAAALDAELAHCQRSAPKRPMTPPAKRSGRPIAGAFLYPASFTEIG